MFTITMADYNDFIEQITIENTLYILHFAWNGNFWTMDIRDSTNTNIISNIVVQPNFPLLLQYQRHFIIKGQLLAVRNDNVQTIGRRDFINKKATLVYMDEDDLNAAIS